ncbi:uncharacterized protein RCC_09719 [Ramularia collo-cygni]|uniref:Transcription factor CBF/NF-Y/archaeal histone domain-containing protein n=1 Tax=Ramularia collo-cygni TaxID=112498 RepID=A0A2D3VFR3_9PEZI|nr:uncharacterized protein RCC_09719 [Ramularia collo-cygni]CZT24002.1 uncharacterized protein RCC_09719 [Ramularia collo-cygni]
MESTYRPASPDLSGSVPSAGVQPLSHLQNHQLPIPGNAFGFPPTSDPQHHLHQYQPPPQLQPGMMPHVKSEDEDEYMPDAQASASKRQRRVKQEPDAMNGHHDAPMLAYQPESTGDPTLGCQLKTSFPVARIKRIMQADEDIGKVAQVTPTVVSRALELFMIKLISAAAHEARGPSAGGASGGKGPKRVLAQHLKRAVYADDKLDFLQEIVGKVPDAPSKAKKEAAGSDSEEAPAKPKRKAKKRKDSGDEI